MNEELFGLSMQSLRRKKRSSLLLFLVLFLSFAFAMISLDVTESMQKTNDEYLRDTYGIWYAAIPGGDGSDEEWLYGREWLSRLGVCKSFGEIDANTTSGRGIGTMDDTFVEIGRIGFQDGRFPSSVGEIAIEADLLSALGYDYTLGQELRFTVSVPVGGYAGEDGALPVSIPVSAERTYTLVGVLREYSDLWTHSGNQPLPSAVITPEAAEELRQAILLAADERRAALSEDGIILGEPKPAAPQLHFSVLPGTEEQARTELTAYMSRKLGLSPDEYSPCINYPVYSGSGSSVRSYNAFYAGVILAMTVLAVVCIYAVRLQDEARQLATFRSIGITKRQLCLMLLYETLCLTLPALLLGTAGGIAGTWLMLRLLVYSGSATVRVALPMGRLAAAAGLWLLGIAAARLAVFGAALRTPLTGRLHIARKQARRNRLLRQAMIVVLAALFGTTVFFTTMESLAPQYMIGVYDTYPDFTVYGDPKGGDYRAEIHDAAADIRQIPGVQSAREYGELEVELSFDGMEDAELLCGLRELFPPGSTQVYGYEHPEGSTVVHLLAVDPKEWSDTVDFDSTGVDMERFLAGDVILMNFPSTKDRDSFLLTPMMTEPMYDACGISAGDTVRIAFEAAGVALDAEVGGLHLITPSMPDRMLTPLASPYSVICSEAFFEKLKNELEPGTTFGDFAAADTYYREQGAYCSCDKIFVHADLGADYFSTDAVLAELCSRSGLLLSSSREEYHAMTQKYLQVLIMLLSGGVCVGIVLLLILWNSLALEAEQSRHNYGVLQAIGLSRRQLILRRFLTALWRGASAAAFGMICYAGYLLRYSIIESAGLKNDWSAWDVFADEIQRRLTIFSHPSIVVILAALIVASVMLLSWAAGRRLMRDDLISKLRDEH